ncbi:Box C/D snoRNA protein 1 [Mortierella sp. GBA30]|nr:Box C/D snoRNA protein 1 [Mortierella sp. GBA30]
MDFFANAFVTRDVVDESDVVVKDGIQIRENAITTSPDVVNCEVCGKVTAKYKCPGCFCQTCSLQCSKQHKLDTTCSGVRSRTHFVERKQYSEQDMMSDYNFLEEVGRSVDNAARENVKLDAGLNPNRKRILGANNQNRNKKRNQMNNRQNQQNPTAADEGSGPGSVAELSLTAAQELEKQGAEGSGSYRDKQLILQAKKRGIHLIMMADGLKKRKENNTQWRDKPSRFLWTIEWLFPEMENSRRILEHKNEEAKTLQEILAGILSKEEYKDVAGKYPSEELHQYRLYFVIPLRHANRPALYPLKITDSVQEALKFKKVLEYPTIMVLGPTSASATKKTTGSSDIPAEALENTTGSEEGSDKGDLILAKYSIEEPPTQWPKKPTTPQQNNQPNRNQKRPNDATTEGETDVKKARLGEKGEDDQVDVDEESSSDNSSDSDSTSDSDDDSSDDSDSDDSSDDEEEANDNESAAEVNTTGTEAEAEANTRSGDVADNEAAASASADQVSLEIGQAILEAFNQDFGQAE